MVSLGGGTKRKKVNENRKTKSWRFILVLWERGHLRIGVLAAQDPWCSISQYMNK